MWIIEPDKSKAKQYAQLFFEKSSIQFDKKGEKKNCSAVIKRTTTYRFLKKDKFEQFLTAHPQELIQLHEELFNTIIGGDFNQKEWLKVRTLKSVPNALTNKYSKINEDEIEGINHFFNYKTYIAQNKLLSYPLAQIMETNTCVYCNRQYTLTVCRENEKLIRPEFDHWLPKSLYPDLTLSYFNLIPSCKFCNSSLKKKNEMELGKYIHPYIDKEAGFKFRFLPLSDGHYTVDIATETDNAEYNKVQNTLDLFKIKEVYNAHAPFELQDLLDLATTNPNDYIETLINNVIKDLNVSKRDAYRMIFGIEMVTKDYLKRPFSKFKMDILKQLKEEGVI